MTEYAAIPSGDIDPDSPITTSLVTKLRDNPIAMFEGAPGAPRLYRAALADLAPGSFLHYRIGAEHTLTTGNSYTETPFKFTIVRSGIIRLKWDASAPGDRDSGFYSRIYVNGVAVGQQHLHTADEYIGITEDVTVKDEDTVSIWVKKYVDACSINKIKNLRVTCSEYPFVTVM